MTARFKMTALCLLCLMAGAILFLIGYIVYLAYSRMTGTGDGSVDLIGLVAALLMAFRDVVSRIGRCFGGMHDEDGSSLAQTGD